MRRDIELDPTTSEFLESPGDYVTAYARDLYECPELNGQIVVIYGCYRGWDRAGELERVADPTGEYHVRPNAATRIGSAGPDEKLFLGRVTGPGVLSELNWWPADETLPSPTDFAAEAASWQGALAEWIAAPASETGCHECGKRVINVATGRLWQGAHETCFRNGGSLLAWMASWPPT